MNILDILLARAMSSGGSTEADVQNAVKRANQAVTNAQTAVNEANSAVETIENIIAQVPEFPTNVEVENENTSTYVSESVVVEDKGTATYKNYKQIGENEDGSMTQKAIKTHTDSLKTELEKKIKKNSLNFGEGNEGTIIIVDNDGAPKLGKISEESIINTQIATGTYQAIDAVGIEINYSGKTFRRIQEATSLSAGEDFNKFKMYGGMKRCMVNNSGRIIAFCGQDNYSDRASNGYQTMVYIPRFYYMRHILEETDDNKISKEVLLISRVPQIGFKVHPAFINEDGEEVDYILYPAYEGCVFDVSKSQYNLADEGEVDFDADMLSSIVGAKPASGLNNNLTITNAEKLAKNRGKGWHITSIKAEGAIQMLAIVEFGTLNLQQEIGKGICNIENLPNINCSSYTGSTSELGNSTGRASSTVNERNGTEYTYAEDGKCSISYRGIEDLWGNIWRFVGGIQILGDGTEQGGVPFICDSLDFENGEYQSAGFNLPSQSGWISRFGRPVENYNWLFVPGEASGANSTLPIGDYVWIQPNLNSVNFAVMGGNWSFGDNDGIFYYGFDKDVDFYSRSYGARAMFIPKKNSTYEANISAWNRLMGD